MCPGDEVIGAPFYVMERVDGTPYRLARRAGAVGPQSNSCHRRRDGRHAGGAARGRPGGGRARRLRPAGRLPRATGAAVEAAARRLAQSRDRAGIDELHARLAGSVPEQGAPAMVHGDFRLDNLLVRERGGRGRGDRRARLGDGDDRRPLDRRRAARRLPVAAAHDADQRGLRRRHWLPDSPRPQSCSSATAQASGRDLSSLSFHLGLAYFKLAVILEGIHYRYTQGQTVGAGFESIGQATAPLVAAGLQRPRGGLNGLRIRRPHAGAAPVGCSASWTSGSRPRSPTFDEQVSALPDRWAWSTAPVLQDLRARRPATSASGTPSCPDEHGAGPDEPAVRPARRDHRPLHPARPCGAQLCGSRHRQHGGARPVRQRRSSRSSGWHPCCAVRSARPSR